MEINRIYNEDCFDFMQKLADNNQKVDLILTSPPYCTPSDKGEKYSEKTFQNYQIRYDVFNGFNSPEEYRGWTIGLFKLYEKILNDNRVVLYNISYSAVYPSLMWLCIADIIQHTEFNVADCIVWKKNSALPQNMNNRATRICEFIFVFCKKGEEYTFYTNKKKVGSKFSGLFNNYIEAPNNDILNTTINKLNSATFSSSMVLQLLHNYAKKDDVVYDSFMGTGTTAVACKQFGCSYLGSELSNAQVVFANERLLGVNKLNNLRVRKLV